MMEPWDGPAAVAFTDGRQIGATLDRNGLRPARYLVTDDDMVILASEAGTLSIPENRIVKKWRLQPGKMFLIDLEQGRIIDDAEIKLQLANNRPYRQWIERLQIKLESLPAPRQAHVATQSSVSLLDRQQAFGWTQEDYKFILEPMATTGEEVIGSMGNDAPLAVLSDRAKPFYNYFRQLFAQVTNPPIDPIREQLVMSLVSFIGPKPNLLDINNVNPPLRLEVSQPVLNFAAMAQIRDIEQVTGKKFRSYELDITYPAAWGPGHRGPRGRAVRARRGRGAKRLQHPDRVRPPGRRRARGHPRAAGDLGRAPAPDPRRPAHQRRPGGGNRLGPRSASLRAAGRLRRRGDPSLPGAGIAGQDERSRKGREELRQGHRQGPEQGHVQDGHLDLHVLHRRADLRGRGPAEGAGGQVLHRHRVQHRRHRHLPGGRGSAAPAPRRVRQ